MIDADGFGRLAAAFLATRENANTRAAYARDLAALAGALGAPPPARGGPGVRGRGRPGRPRRGRDARRAPARLVAALARRAPGRLSTRRRRVAAARAFCRWWARAFALENPARDLRPPAAAGEGGQEAIGREVVALSPAAVRAMCEAAAAPGPLGARTAALIEVLYGCGLRASEAAALDLSACHLDDPDDPFLLVEGKGGRRRAVAVPREALARLRGLPARRPAPSCGRATGGRAATRPATATPTRSS